MPAQSAASVIRRDGGQRAEGRAEDDMEEMRIGSWLGKEKPRMVQMKVVPQHMTSRDEDR